MLLEHEVLDSQQLKQLMAGEPMDIRTPRPLTPSKPEGKEEKVVDTGERAGGILPPPMAHPKPTS
jgi:hypothetical protein